jgi:anaerobic selenocysteine-containing dehydrogenase
LFINYKDAHKLGFAEGDEVDITSVWFNNETRNVTGFKIRFYDIPQGDLAAYYPETNPLVALDSVGDRSYTPTSKSIPVFLTKRVSNRII